MKSRTSGVRKRSLHRPTHAGIEAEVHSRSHRLCKGKILVLNAPGANVFRQTGDACLAAKLFFQANITAGAEEFADGGRELEIPHRISGEQKGTSPRPADYELELRAQVARAQTAFGERAGLMERACAYCHP